MVSATFGISLNVIFFIKIGLNSFWSKLIYPTRLEANAWHLLKSLARYQDLDDLLH